MKIKWGEKTLIDTKKKTVSVYITEYAKITLTERANRLGLNLSTYLEYLSRQPTKERRSP